MRPEPMGGGDGGDHNGRWMEMMTGAIDVGVYMRLHVASTSTRLRLWGRCCGPRGQQCVQHAHAEEMERGPAFGLKGAHCEGVHIAVGSTDVGA